MNQISNKRPPVSNSNIASQALPLPCEFGRYRLTKIIAVGGMAQIYLAESHGEEGFVKKLVIKRLDPIHSQDPHYANLFINEAKLLVSLIHSNIVPIFDFGRVGEELYIAMEHIQGVTLGRMLFELQKRRERISPGVAAFIAAEVCKGLAYAHQRTDAQGRPAGIIHRDIKPTNILLSFAGEVKIVDFGVAKLSTRTDISPFAGTICYMAPEQASSREIDARSDIYSLGLVLYEMLLGLRAYRQKEPAALINAVRRAEPLKISGDVPIELQKIILTATARDPAKRYSSAQEMERYLSQFLLYWQTRSDSAPMRTLNMELRNVLEDLPFEEERREIQSLAASPPPDVAPAAPIASVPGVQVSGLLDLQAPLDMQLLNQAATEFRSVLLTRYLAEQTIPRRRYKILAIALAAFLPGFIVLFLITFHENRQSNEQIEVVKLEAHDMSTKIQLDAQSPLDGALVPELVIDASAPPVIDKPGRKSTVTRSSNAVRPARSLLEGFGYLNLNSIPWSEVWIDGLKLPQATPVLKLKLPAGRHKVILINREQNLQRAETILIKPGQQVSKVVRLRD